MVFGELFALSVGVVTVLTPHVSDTSFLCSFLQLLAQVLLCGFPDPLAGALGVGPGAITSLECFVDLVFYDPVFISLLLAG